MLEKMNQMPEDLIETQFSIPYASWTATHKHSRLLGTGKTKEQAIEDLHNQMEAFKPKGRTP